MDALLPKLEVIFKNWPAVASLRCAWEMCLNWMPMATWWADCALADRGNLPNQFVCIRATGDMDVYLLVIGGYCSVAWDTGLASPDRQ